jgi:hypothetical protein
MSLPAYFPFRSAAVRDSYLAYYDSLAAKEWRVASVERMVPILWSDVRTHHRPSGRAAPRPIARGGRDVADVGSQHPGAIPDMPDLCGRPDRRRWPDHLHQACPASE